MEGPGELADIRARLRERRETARGEGAARQRPGRANVGGAECLVGEEGDHERQGAQVLSADLILLKTCWLQRLPPNAFATSSESLPAMALPVASSIILSR